VRRTLNEIWRVCQKAAEGAGVPAGLDIDAADGAVWLLARGFDVVDGLSGALESLDGGDGAWAIKDDPGGGALDATGQPGAILAPALVDLLVARNGAPLAVTGLTAPLFLLPAAARHAEGGRRLRFAITGRDGARFMLQASPEAGPAIFGPAGVEAIAATLAGPAEYSVEAVSGPSAAAQQETDEGVTTLADAVFLAAAETRSIDEGIIIDRDPWSSLQTFFDRMLVPATAESRRRGAGAQASDNE
jgi:hypothetical protein